MNNKKNIVIWIVIFLIVSAVFNNFENIKREKEFSKIAFSEFMDAVEQDKVEKVLIQGENIIGKFKDGQGFRLFSPNDPNLISDLRKRNVKIDAEPINNPEYSLFGILISWFPMILLIGVWIYFMKGMSAGGSKAMSFGRSRAKLINQSKKILFADVAGVEEAKEDLQEIVEFLKEPSKFQRLGGKIPKGVLLMGPPGTGKTLLAKAVAGEANVPFFTISGSDFVEMFVGVGASRVRDMFEQGKKNAPCLIFIDEIDAVGRHRGAGLGGGNDEREQTLNQLLVEMDGFETNEGVILIAATNRPDVLDPALLRPGRFDRQITVPNPDILGREQILNVHIKKIPVATDVNLKIIARGTPGFSGADLANLVNEAALIAARRNKRLVTMNDFEYAKDKILMGAERKSMVMDENEKKLTAYHEAGHAICGLNSLESDPIHKATIIPRGRALGLVMQLPEKDHLSYSITKFKSRLVISMGGRVAEELIFGPDKITSGASSDIAQATKIARAMVTEWGMSELGPIAFEGNEDEVFLGRSVAMKKNISDETARKIDEKVKEIIDEAYLKAKNILTKHKKDLIAMAEALIEYETLTGDEITKVLKGEKLNKENEIPKSSVGRTSVPVTNIESENKPQKPKVKPKKKEE